MNVLTLEQARHAGRFAWHRDGWLLVDGEIIHLLLAAHEEPLPSLTIAYAAPAAEADLNHGASVGGGWRHLPACDCEFCHP